MKPMDQQTTTHISGLATLLASLFGVITPQNIYMIIAIVGVLVSIISAIKSNHREKERTEAYINFLKNSDRLDDKTAADLDTKLDGILKDGKEEINDTNVSRVKE